MIHAAAAAPVLLAEAAAAQPAGTRAPSTNQVDARRDFGCAGDGRADDSQAMLAFFRHCVETGAEGFIPAGTYRIAWGTLLFRGGHVDRGWPNILTGGSDLVILKGFGAADAPMIEINNRSAEGRATAVSDDRVWAGGQLGGFTVVPEARLAGAANRHALRLSGIQQTRFGPIVAADLQGSTLHIPRVTTSDLSPRNPDPFHVYACRFAYLAALRCTGRAILNENGVGMTQCQFEAVRAIQTGEGGIFGVGGGNIVQALSMGACRGWAVDDGSQDAGVAPATFLLETAELDDVEYGIRLNHIHDVRIARVRIIHRLNYSGRRDGMYPRTALSLGGGAEPRVTDARIDIQYRFDSGWREDLAALIDLHDNAGTLVDVRIDLSMGEIRRGAGEAPVISNAGSANVIRVRRNGRTVLDTLPRRLAGAAAQGAGGLAVPNGGLGTRASILAFENKRFDSSGDYDSARHAFVVPFAGRLWVTIVLPLELPVGTAVRLGVLLERGGRLFVPTTRRFAHATAGICHYQLTQILDVAKDDLIYAAADQNGPQPVDTKAIFSMDECIFQAMMV